MREGDAITVCVFKHDGAEHRRWHARIVRQVGSLIVLEGEFESDVQHHLLGEIRHGTRTIEYYWLDRWYNVFRFLNDDGTTRLYYCNVNSLPTLADGVLSYIDFDIDILVQPDLSHQILDLEEFAANAARYGYTEEERQSVQAAVADVIAMIRNRQSPFQPAPSSMSSVVNSL